MTDFIIKVENLGKKYSIHHQQEQYGYVTLRDLLARKARAPLRWLTAQSAKRNGRAELSQSEIRNSQSPVEDFWALRDVSFEVKEGEVVGIIGRNGAGKSTLLKILSQITEPTVGRVRLRGRVASLLEVGTGFHPELTGRENIFLNGAVLGMTREEIRRKFDEIVAFAEVEKFLDTPVKRYSSGMYVRLAFAVAAHLEPEILIIDEVLAVGDAEFQKKCLGKMDDVAKSGRTVLFVSHNIGAIRALCKNSLWLEQGRLREQGPAATVTDNYMRGVKGRGAVASIAKSQHLRGSGSISIEAASLVDWENGVKNTFLIGEAFDLKLDYKVLVPTRGTFWVLVATMEGNVIFSSFQKDTSEPALLERDGSISSAIGSVKFLPGEYVVSAGVFDSSLDIVDWVDSIGTFQILPQFATGRAFDHRYGVITQELEWRKVPKT